MSEHIYKMKELASQLEAVGASITEDDQVATLLCSLPESYNSLITALESRADNLTLEFVIARLLHYEHKRKENSLTSDTGKKALLSKHDRTNQKSFKNPKERANATTVEYQDTGQENVVNPRKKNQRRAKRNKKVHHTMHLLSMHNFIHRNGEIRRI